MSITDNNTPDKHILSVTELTARIKQILEIGFAKVEVTGEISRLTRPSSGHLYFTIKDAHAAISAVIWRSTAMRLKNLPQEGGEFVFTGHISLYEPRGTYQLVISRVEAAGAGKLAAEFERRKQDYAARGWFDSAVKKAIPALPKHIGIVTSPTAAAFEDVKKVLATRPAWLQMTLAPALVQGSRAPASMAKAIRKLSRSAPDVILLVRGGGSMEDLWCFNDETVVKAIVDCPIPIISGVGHEIDTTLADLAADLRAATPSNAAELCCPSRDELRRRLPRLTSLQGLLAHRLGQNRRDKMALQQRQTHAWQRQTDAHHHLATQLTSRLTFTVHNSLKDKRLPLRLLQKRLAPLQPVQRLEQQRRLWLDKRHELIQGLKLVLQNSRNNMALSQQQLQHQTRQLLQLKQLHAVLAGKLSELNPDKVLERGYSLNYAGDGTLITRVAQLAEGESMQVRFKDGDAHTRIESITKEENL